MLDEEWHVQRHDLIARMCRLKMNKIMDLLTKDMIFGPVDNICTV